MRKPTHPRVLRCNARKVSITTTWLDKTKVDIVTGQQPVGPRGQQGWSEVDLDVTVAIHPTSAEELILMD